MEAAGAAAPPDAETVRLQAEEHPLIEDALPATPAEHCLRLMHLRAYDEAVGHAAGRDVLDVGCNTGYGTIRFAPVARRVVGVDVSPRAIDAARERAPDGRPEFLLTSGFDLPFPDGSFDLVTSFQVLEHVPDPGTFLRELTRVTRPGGEVILATPNAATRLYPGMTPWNRFHVHEYTANELRDLLGGVFAQVTILGMFGAADLYETEIQRVDAARQRIRRTEEAAQAAAGNAAGRATVTPAPIRQARPLPIRVARAFLPAFVRRWLRSVVRPTPARPARAEATAKPMPKTPGPVEPPPMDLDAFLRFTVADLHYAETDLDRAMDLLAICHRARSPGEIARREAERPRATLCHRSGPSRRPFDPMGM